MAAFAIGLAVSIANEESVFFICQAVNVPVGTASNWLINRNVKQSMIDYSEKRARSGGV
ncbi:hypothetical protein [Methylobacter sp.]